MPAISPSLAKNFIRRSLLELVDPSPTAAAQAQIWDYFESACAYCGAALNRSRKEGHMDHLVSAAANGSNHLANRVLSCAPCNEAEKRDADWMDFLRMKNSDDEQLFSARKTKIENWSARESLADLDSVKVRRQLALEAAATVIAEFERQVSSLRPNSTDSARGAV